MNYANEVALKMLSIKVGELNEFLQGIDTSRWGDNVIDIAMGIITEQRKEIELLDNTVHSMKSEIEYVLHSNKTLEVKRHYLENAIRYADKVLVVEIT